MPVELFRRLMADDGAFCTTSRYRNVRDNAVMESFFSSPETARLPPCRNLAKDWLSD